MLHLGKASERSKELCTAVWDWGFFGYQLLCRGKSQEIRTFWACSINSKNTWRVAKHILLFVMDGWKQKALPENIQVLWKHKRAVLKNHNSYLILFFSANGNQILSEVDWFWYCYVWRQTATFPALVRNNWLFKIPQKLKRCLEFISSDFLFITSVQFYSDTNAA